MKSDRVWWCVCGVWVLTLLILGMGCGLNTEYKKEIWTEGAVPPAGPPAAVGERAADGQVVLGGGLEATLQPTTSARTRQEGATGNRLLLRQARGYFGVGVTKHVELGLLGRVAVGRGVPMFTDSEESPNLRGAALGGGGVVRMGGHHGRLEINLDTELEVMSLPYDRRIKLTVTRMDPLTSCGAYYESTCGGSGGGFDDSRGGGHATASQRRAAVAARIGVSGSVQLVPDVAVLLFGVHTHIHPYVIGYQVYTWQCDEPDGGCIGGPVNDSEVPVFAPIGVLTGLLGAQLNMADNLALIMLVHGGIEGEAHYGGAGTPGGTLQLQLRQ